MGGAFGGKESQATIIAGVAAVLAWQDAAAGQAAAAARRRHARHRQAPSLPDPLRRSGFDGDGRILALDVMLAADGGSVADLHARGRRPARCATPTTATGCRMSASAACACKTNTVSNTAFRGFGGPQGMLAMEDVDRRDRARTRPAGATCASATIYGIGRNDVTPYGQRGRGQHHRARAGRARTQPSTIAALARRRSTPSTATARSSRRASPLMPVKFGISFNRPTLNQAGALVHVYTDGAMRAEPRRHRDGPGPVHQGRAGGGRGVRHRPRPRPHVARPHRQGAEHLADRGLLGLRPQRHGGAAMPRGEIRRA